MVAIFALATTFLLSAVAVQAQLPSGLPPACAAGACKLLIDKFGSASSAAACAGDVTCLCSNDVARSIKDCYQCAVDANADGLDKQTTDAGLAAYVDSCKAGGHPVDLGGSSGSNNSKGGSSGRASSLQVSSIAAAVALGGLALL